MLIPAIVAAAGGSTRCPGGKLLTLYHGKPLLQWLLARLSEHPGVGRILVVTGNQRSQVEELLYPFPTTQAVHNPGWQEGLSSSLKFGIATLPPTPGFLIALGDTPFFSNLTLDRVLPSSVAEGKRVRVPTYGGQNGHPVYFPGGCRSAWQSLEGDQGAKPLLKLWRERVDEISVDDPGILKDFDTLDDFPTADTLGVAERICRV